MSELRDLLVDFAFFFEAADPEHVKIFFDQFIDLLDTQIIKNCKGILKVIFDLALNTERFIRAKVMSLYISKFFFEKKILNLRLPMYDVFVRSTQQ